MAAYPLPPGAGAEEPEMFPEPGGEPAPADDPTLMDPSTPSLPVPEIAQSGPVLPVGSNVPENYDRRQSPRQVGYEWGDCCSTCLHFMAPEGCELVNGHIRPDGVCNLYEKRPGLPIDAVYGD